MGNVKKEVKELLRPNRMKVLFAIFLALMPSGLVIIIVGHGLMVIFKLFVILVLYPLSVLLEIDFSKYFDMSGSGGYTGRFAFKDPLRVLLHYMNLPIDYLYKNLQSLENAGFLLSFAAALTYYYLISCVLIRAHKKIREHPKGRVIMYGITLFAFLIIAYSIVECGSFYTSINQKIKKLDKPCETDFDCRVRGFRSQFTCGTCISKDADVDSTITDDNLFIGLCGGGGATNCAGLDFCDCVDGTCVRADYGRLDWDNETQVKLWETQHFRR